MSAGRNTGLLIVAAAILVAVVLPRLSASHPAAEEVLARTPSDGAAESRRSPTLADPAPTSRPVDSKSVGGDAATQQGNRRVSVRARFDDGTPISDIGLNLWLYNRSSPSSASATRKASTQSRSLWRRLRLDAEGRVSFEAPNEAEIHLTLEDDWFGFSKRNNRLGDGGDVLPGQTEHEILLPANLFRVAVTDTEGRGIAGRSLFARGRLSSACRRMETNADGVAEFRGLPAGDVYLYDLGRPQFEVSKDSRPRLLERGDEPGERLPPTDTAVVSATVDGEPIEGHGSEKKAWIASAPSECKIVLRPVSLTKVRVLDARLEPLEGIEVAAEVQIEGHEFRFPTSLGRTGKDGVAWMTLANDCWKFMDDAKISLVQWNVLPPGGGEAIQVVGRPGIAGDVVDCGDVVLSPLLRWRFTFDEDFPSRLMIRPGRLEDPLDYLSPFLEHATVGGTATVLPRPDDDVLWALGAFPPRRLFVRVSAEALAEDGPGQRVSLDSLQSYSGIEKNGSPESEALRFRVWVVDATGIPAIDAEVTAVDSSGRIHVPLLGRDVFEGRYFSAPRGDLRVTAETFPLCKSTVTFHHSKSSDVCEVRLPPMRALHVTLVSDEVPREAMWSGAHVQATAFDSAPTVALHVERTEAYGDAVSSEFHQKGNRFRIFAPVDAAVLVRVLYAGRWHEAKAPPAQSEITLRVVGAVTTVAITLPRYPFATTGVVRIFDDSGLEVFNHRQAVDAGSGSWSTTPIPLQAGRHRLKYETTSPAANPETTEIRELSFTVGQGAPTTVTLPR